MNVQVFINSNWKSTKIELLKDGDIFRVFNDKGERTKDGSGRDMWTARCVRFVNEKWRVYCYGLS